MKKIILTESQFKFVVREMMGENGYQKSGFIPPDGNSMTGGRMAHSSYPETVKVKGTAFLDWLDQQKDEDTYVDYYWDELYNYFADKVLTYDANREEGFDDSVGIPKYSQINLDKANYTDGEAVIDGAPIPDEVKMELKQEFRNYAEWSAEEN